MIKEQEHKTERKTVTKKYSFSSIGKAQAFVGSLLTDGRCTEIVIRNKGSIEMYVTMPKHFTKEHI